MNRNDNLRYNTFISLIRAQRLHDAIHLLRALSEQKMTWEITDEINRIDSSYGYLLKYAMEGFDDPGRRDIYDNLTEQLIICHERLDRHCRLRTDHGIYSTALSHVANRSVADVIKAAVDTSADADAPSSGRPALEMSRTDLFDKIFTAFPLSKDDTTAIADLLNSPADAANETPRLLAISALTMGCMEYYDQARILLLADAYSSHTSDTVALSALTGLLLALWDARRRPLHPAVANRIAALADSPSFDTDLRIVFLELIRTRDTDRITRKFQDEIIPEMMRHKNDFLKSMKGIKPDIQFSEADLEENPEWQELLDKTGLAERLKELSEMQEEGGDVFMATFAHLKSFPFFFTMANWFLPFDPHHSAASPLGPDAAVVTDIIAAAPMMCDSDKYSMVLALASSPEQQRRLMLSQLEGQINATAELRASSLFTNHASRREIVAKYVQNLYRFFRLFRRKSDFIDPFATEIDLTESEILRPYLADKETLQLISEFYFTHKFYPEALRVMRIYEREAIPDAKLYQQMGFCLQKIGNNPEALKFYEQAELLNSQNLWTLRRIAACHRIAGNFDKALDYYRRIDSLQPDNLNTTMHIGHCQLGLRHFDKAVKAFYKVDYLAGDDRARRPLAWALMMNRNNPEAEKIYTALLADAPEPDDLLNAGHCALVRNDYPLAISRYAAYIRRLADEPNTPTHRTEDTPNPHRSAESSPTHRTEDSPNPTQRFAEAIDNDRRDLLELGVNPTFLPLIADAAVYAAHS